MKLELELPNDTLVAVINYLYVTPYGMTLTSTNIDGDDFIKGKKVCKGAVGYVEENQQ